MATLIAAGADVDAAVLHPRGGAPETALHWAASSDDVGVLDALLDGGADIEAPGAIFTGGTAMSDAVVFAQWSAARRLLERGATTTLWQAAALGLLDSVQQHLSTDPRPSSEQITNALWHAARGGQLAVAEHLVEQGADLNWIGHDRKTPLDAARDSGVTELVEWLEGRGARPRAIRQRAVTGVSQPGREGVVRATMDLYPTTRRPRSSVWSASEPPGCTWGQAAAGLRLRHPADPEGNRFCVIA